MTSANTQTAANIQPVATLREEDGFVLGIFQAGAGSLNYVSYVVRRQGDRIRDHFNDGVEGETGQKMVGWMPIPYADADVEAAISAA
jgi:hypothetical protein